MRVLRPSEQRRMPWKNGGGVTSEILIEPGANGGDRFLYRLSIADVAKDGPFSRFDGYDRHILLLEGAGMKLDAGPSGVLELEPLTPRAFSGEWDVTATLKEGPVRDLNLIVDRTRAAAQLQVHVLNQATVITAPTCIAYVLEGTLANAEPGDTLIADGELHLVPGESARLVIARIIHGPVFAPRTS